MLHPKEWEQIRAALDGMIVYQHTEDGSTWGKGIYVIHDKTKLFNFLETFVGDISEQTAVESTEKTEPPTDYRNIDLE